MTSESYKITVNGEGSLTYVHTQFDVTEAVVMSSSGGSQIWTGKVEDIEVGDTIKIDIFASADGTVFFDYEIENTKTTNREVKQGRSNTSNKVEDTVNSPQVRETCPSK